MLSGVSENSESGLAHARTMLSEAQAYREKHKCQFCHDLRLLENEAAFYVIYFTKLFRLHVIPLYAQGEFVL